MTILKLCAFVTIKVDEYIKYYESIYYEEHKKCQVCLLVLSKI